MGRDEQIEEREVLDSIFPDEITGVSSLAWSICEKLTCPCIRYFRDILPRLNSIGCAWAR